MSHESVTQCRFFRPDCDCDSLCTGFVSLLRFLAFTIICIQLPMSFIGYFMIKQSDEPESTHDVEVVIKSTSEAITPAGGGYQSIANERESLLATNKAEPYSSGYQSIGSGDLSG